MLTQIQTGKKSGDKIEEREQPRSPSEVILVGGAQLAYNLDSTILNYRYAYNTQGLMDLRSESVFNHSERFEYDNLDRLSIIANNAQQMSQYFQFSNNGNITLNSNIGTYLYNNTKKRHAVTSVIHPPKPSGAISEAQCNVKYNLFNQPYKITEDDLRLELAYGANEQRNMMEKYRNDTTLQSRRYYVSKYYESETDSAINMNARLYDPVIGRFFSPDKFVQIPDFTQSYNRYSYCLNNPLHYTDPSGNSFIESVFNLLFWPAKALTQGVEWVNDKINGDTRTGPYWDPGYIFGNKAPAPYFNPNSASQIFYGHPLYNPPGTFSSNTPISSAGLNADNSTPEQFDFEWYWAGGTFGKLKNTKSGNLYGREVPWGKWYTRIVRTGGHEADVMASNQLEIVTIAINRKDYSGFLGALEYFWTGGNENGIRYNYDGTVAGVAPIIGMPPIPAFRGGIFIKGGKFVQKMGKAKGNMPGNHATQNKQFQDIVNKLNLNSKQAEQLHREISGQGYGYHEILQLAKGLFK
jgi:RHS repeat-associated protein